MEQSTTPGCLAIAGLTFLALGAVCFVAFLITATRALTRQIRTARRKDQP